MKTGRRNRQTAFPALLAFLFLSSCSLIWEDRSRCPCLLTLRLQGLPAHPVSVTLEGTDFRETYRVERDTSFRVPVPKDGIRWEASCGAQADGDGLYRIPYGYDCPSLYLGGGSVDTACDTAGVDILLHKHFCTLALDVVSPPGWGEPYWAEIRGPVDALSADGTPVEGRFSCRLETGMSVRLPRQAPEATLWLDITMPDRVVRSFALDAYLLDAGYDWTAPDLEDCSLELRLSVTRLLFQGDVWTAEIPRNVDI